MATILDSFDIDSPLHGKAFKIDLAEGLDNAHLDFMETQWAPAMKRQYNLAILQFFQLPAADRTTEKWDEIWGSSPSRTITGSGARNARSHRAQIAVFSRY